MEDSVEYIYPTVRIMSGDKAPEPFDPDQYYYEKDNSIRWFNLE